MYEYRKFTDFQKFIDEVKDKPRSIIDDDSYIKTGHWPSGLTSCTRKQVYDFAEMTDSDFDMKSKLNFAFGAAFESMLVERFGDAKILEADEQSFKLYDDRLKYPVSGRVDIIVTLPEEFDEEQVMRPVELKTMGTSQWDDKDYGTMQFPGGISQPKLYHVAQLNMYMKRMNVDWGILAYANKDDSQILFWQIDFSQELYDAIIEHLATVESQLEEYKETKVAPPAIMLDDDAKPVEIKDIPLTVYKRDTKYNDIGDPKLDKMDKANGVYKFPCIWQDQKTKKFSYCSYFEKCHGSKLEEIGITMEDIKNGGR